MLDILDYRFCSCFLGQSKPWTTCMFPVSEVLASSVYLLHSKTCLKRQRHAVFDAKMITLTIETEESTLTSKSRIKRWGIIAIIWTRVTWSWTLLAEFFISSSLKKTHNNHCHVIATQSTHLTVRGKTSCEKLFTDLNKNKNNNKENKMTANFASTRTLQQPWPSLKS